MMNNTNEEEFSSQESGARMGSVGVVDEPTCKVLGLIYPLIKN